MIQPNFEGASEAIDVNGQVGETAGKVWHALSSARPLTLTQLKKKENGSGELLSFGLGWLVREDKSRSSRRRRAFVSG
jgi:hypothetical protein